MNASNLPAPDRVSLRTLVKEGYVPPAEAEPFAGYEVEVNLEAMRALDIEVYPNVNLVTVTLRDGTVIAAASLVWGLKSSPGNRVGEPS